jgi:hypothetical protein
VTPEETLRRDMLTAQTSEAKRKACDRGRAALLATTTAIADQTARYAGIALRGPIEGAKHAKQQLDNEKARAELLQLILNAGEAELVALEAAEAKAVPELQAIFSLANEKSAALASLHGKEYPGLKRAALLLIAATLDTLQTRAAAMQAAIRAPELARAKVNTSLAPLTLFAPGQGIGTVLDFLKLVPALADPDAPDTHLAPHYPPRPVRAPAPPAEPRPAAEPYVLRGRTVVHPAAPTPPPAATHMGPRGLRPDSTYADAAARALG